MGPAELTEPFRGVGLAEERADESNALDKAMELSRSGYKIIFYAQKFYPILGEFLAKREGGVFPTFIPIPSLAEEEPYAMRRVKELIKKAIGVEVYWESE